MDATAEVQPRITINMTTNIATTLDQSARLLQCGVSADTADMHFDMDEERYKGWKFTGTLLKLRKCPAWSLSALLGLLPKEIKVDEDPYSEVQKYGLLIYPFMGGWQVDYQYCENDECHCLKCVHATDLVEACVKTIEWLTANGYKLNEL